MNFIEQAYKGKLDYRKYLFFSLLFFCILALGIFAKTLVQEEVRDTVFTTYDLALNLLTFVIFFVLLFVWVKYHHEQPLISLTTSRKKVDFKRIFFAFAFWIFLAVFVFVVSYMSSPEEIELIFDTESFLKLFIVSILLFPFQTSFEEYFFRGYLMQAIGVKYKKKFLALILTSVLFGLVHFANPEVLELGIGVMVFYIGSGLFFGIVTLMDEGLELALGLHLANNLVSALLVTTSWSVFRTDAIFMNNSKPDLLSSVIFPIFILYPLVIFVFAKKYKWTNFKEHLFGKVK